MDDSSTSSLDQMSLFIRLEALLLLLFGELGFSFITNGVLLYAKLLHSLI